MLPSPSLLPDADPITVTAVHGLVGGADEGVKAVEEWPGGVRLGLLDLVLLLDGVDAVLVLDIGLEQLGVVIAGGDDLLPLWVAKAVAAEHDKAPP